MIKVWWKRATDSGFTDRLTTWFLLMIAGPISVIVLLRETLQVIAAMNGVLHPVNAFVVIGFVALMLWLFNLAWQGKFFMKWGTLFIGVALASALWQQGNVIIDGSVIGYLVLYFAPLIWVCGMLDYVWENYVPAVVQWFMMDEQEREKAKLEEAL